MSRRKSEIRFPHKCAEQYRVCRVETNTTNCVSMRFITKKTHILKDAECEEALNVYMYKPHTLG